MRRAMVFIDYENFEVSRFSLYKNELGSSFAPFIDIANLPKRIVSELDKRAGLKVDLLKTFLFAPKPDEFLMQEEWRAKRCKFLEGLDNVSYFNVIFGEHSAKPVKGGYNDRDINERSSYYVVEKGTDVNIATNLLTKAFHNSYDVAIVVSGDTDYIPVYDVLNSMGKLVVVVAVEGQNLSKLVRHTDLQYSLTLGFLQSCEQN